MVTRSQPRQIWLRVLVGAAVGLIVLWALTFFVGGRQARSDALARCEMPLKDMGFAEYPYSSAPEKGFSGHPVFGCRVTAYLPCMLRVEMLVYTGGEFFYSTSDWYVWFGKLIRH